MKKIKIAQIGTSLNSHGSDIWSTLSRRSDLFEVVGYALPEGERERFPERMGVFCGHREMTVGEILADPEIEAVAVETEEIHLTKYARMVAEAGKHLHMEKPGGLSLCEFRELIRTLKEKGLAFSLGYMYRFNPEIREAIARVERGELGRIYSVEAHMDCYHPVSVREWLRTFPGGMTFFLGCHLIDLIYRIQGKPERVVPLSTRSGIDGVDAEDIGMAVFQYPNGVSFLKTSAVERGGFLRRQLVICGERGTIEIRPLELYEDDKLYTEAAEATSDTWLATWEGHRSAPFGRYDAMMENFAKIVRGKENPYGYDYELSLYELVLKACGKEE